MHICYTNSGDKMDVKKYKFGQNLVYEIEEPTDDMFNMLSDKFSDKNILKDISLGYKKLLIGMGNISKIDDLLALFDLCMCENIIVHTINLNDSDIEFVNNKINMFKLNVNITNFNTISDNADYNIEIYCPIIRKD